MEAPTTENQMENIIEHEKKARVISQEAFTPPLAAISTALAGYEASLLEPCSGGKIFSAKFRVRL